MKGKLYLISLVILLSLLVLVPFVSSSIETLGTFQKDTCISLIQICDNCSYVNISAILLPNSSVILLDITMDKSGTYYNYTFCSTNISGEYIINGVGDLDGEDTVFNYNLFINPQGIKSTAEKTSLLKVGIYFFLIISVLLFFAFFKTETPPVKWTYFIFGLMFLISSINMLAITLSDEVVNSQLESFFDVFTAFFWYFLWFSGGILIVMWIFTFLNTWFYDKNKENFDKFGGEY